MNTQLIKRRALAATCIIVLLAVLVGIVSWAGSYYPAYNKDSKTISKGSGSSISTKTRWAKLSPQTVVYGLIKDHFANAEKTPKLLFIGYDGAYALLPALNYGDPDSAISAVAAEGGLYLSILRRGQPRARRIPRLLPVGPPHLLAFGLPKTAFTATFTR